jgi:hypothetical protein
MGHALLKMALKRSIEFYLVESDRLCGNNVIPGSTTPIVHLFVVQPMMSIRANCMKFKIVKPLTVSGIRRIHQMYMEHCIFHAIDKVSKVVWQAFFHHLSQG